MLLYFYCDFREKESQESTVVLGTLLCQLCTQLGGIPPEMGTLMQRHGEEGREMTPPTSQELEAALLQILGRCDHVTIVIDALDELHDRYAFITLLSKLPSIFPSRVRILVSSREEYDIKDAFHQELSKSISITAADKDVDFYVDSAIKTNKRLRRLSPELQDNIRKSLDERCRGMFRWVALQTQSLGSLRTDRDIRQALNTLPKDLYETYERVLTKIRESDRAVVATALLWLAQSPRPLVLSELATETRWHPDDLLEALGSLVKHDPKSDIVVLAHHTVQEYLSSDGCKTNAPHFYIPSGKADVHMAEILLTYLLLKDFGSGAAANRSRLWTRVENYPLLQYAARYWPFFARKVMSKSTEVTRLACLLLHPARTPNFWAWIEVLITQGYFTYKAPVHELDGAQRNVFFKHTPKHLTPLYYAASFGLLEVVEHLISCGVDVDARGGIYGGTALPAA